MTKKRKRLLPEQYIDGIIRQDKVILSQAITLIESDLATDVGLAQQILEAILPLSGKSIRVGITGVPGVGKSTFIEVFGKFVTSLQKKLAVLAIDPSSQISRGSIMGDKTRMQELAIDPLAYIRPSPTKTSLGGVAQKTRETMLLCEAAGYEVIFIETIGVGQSETLVRGMVDFFLLLMLAGAGDELQGMKKGIMEMADTLVITKADGENKSKAYAAKAEYQSALHLFPLAETGWIPKVLTCSALQKEGIKDIWDMICEYEQKLKNNSFFEKIRSKQNLNWMHDTIRQQLEENFYKHPKVKENLHEIEILVSSGKIPSLKGAAQLLELYRKIST